MVRLSHLRGTGGLSAARRGHGSAGSGPECGAGHRQCGQSVPADGNDPPGRAVSTPAGAQAAGLGAGAAAGGQLQKLRRQQKRIRSNDTHHISRALADQAHTLVVEDLHTRSLTKSAKGTPDSPGTNVKAKDGLNRGILASNWGQLAPRLQYKWGQLVPVDPRYPSQTCHQCGHGAAANRPAQAVFRCQRCDFHLHADHKAALNIPVRYVDRTVARGTGATARREAFPSGTSMTREQGIGARPVV